MYRIVRNTYLASRSGLSVKTLPLDRDEGNKARSVL
jgi:hypothetical protein